MFDGFVFPSLDNTMDLPRCLPKKNHGIVFHVFFFREGKGLKFAKRMHPATRTVMRHRCVTKANTTTRNAVWCDQ